MVGRNNFGVTLDVAQVTALADRLQGFTAQKLGRLVVDAINETVDSAYDLGRQRMLRGINLTEDYVQRKMQVDHATDKMPVATITAFGGKGFTTSLSHYGAMQLDRDVTWSNARISAMGKKFGNWPGWTKRTGSPGVGIAVDKKAAGRSVEVVRGARKSLRGAFAIPGKTDGDGNLVVFRRQAGTDSVQALQGPSVYQLFRVAAAEIEGQVAGELEQAVIDVAERRLREELG